MTGAKPAASEAGLEAYTWDPNSHDWGRLLAPFTPPLPRAGEIIVSGTERRKLRILVGSDARLISLVTRLVPVRYWKLVGPRLRE